MYLIPDIKLRNGVWHRKRDVATIIAAAREANEAFKADTRTQGVSSCRNGGSFTGTESMDEFLSMVENGWPEGIANAKGLDGLSSDAHERLQFERNVAGAFPIVPAHLSNNPMSMLQPVVAPSDNKRSLTLVIDNCYNCNIRSENVLEYAQEVMRVVAWLSAEQVECSVVSLVTEMVGRWRNTRVYYTTEIKRKGDVLMPERLAVYVHTSFFRRGWFAMLEHEHHEHKLQYADACLAGYGRSETPELSDLPLMLDEDVSSIVMLPKADNSGNAKQAIENAINLKLKRT